MFGFLYLGMALISDMGARLKEFFYNIDAHVDPRTNTYMGYDGRLHDSKTNQYRFWNHNEKGDEVLHDNKMRVVKNITEEERNACLEEARQNPNGRTVCHPKNHRIEVSYTNGFGIKCSKLKELYLDIETGKRYITVMVPNKYTGKGECEFYAYAENPWHIVRMSDRQRENEKKNLNSSKNWITHPEKEQMCIDYYNGTAIGMEEFQKCHVIW